MAIKAGDFVIFSKYKTSSHPSPHAKAVSPAQHGDTYSYVIDKFWKVVRVFDDDTIEVETRRGKRNRIDANTPLVRKIRPWERVIFRHRLF
ncbi:MAG: hypothetical protein MRJ96_11200 [Nitrospirales bacterium]|nr:hypothetical protein [Nitrospira sp.]MDR4502007.1 hypothetical protein [Nitrospirales bacterium]